MVNNNNINYIIQSSSSYISKNKDDSISDLRSKKLSTSWIHTNMKTKINCQLTSSLFLLVKLLTCNLI